MDWLDNIPNNQPVLIAGPTASGKSGLALRIAGDRGGVVINADALQVYSNWQVLTARPGSEDLARAPHALYGHVPPQAAYSVGHWLREVAELLDGPRPVIVGGTGLYLSALTEGLAEIPPTPPEVRAEADRRVAAGGSEGLMAELDAATRDRIDPRNPVRIQRAWEVLQATGTGLADWQDRTGRPLLPVARATAILVDASPEVLNPRIEARFDAMLAAGALAEVRANRAGWSPQSPAYRAIGAAELMAYLDGTMSLQEARTRAIVATRQYAKRQRTWFRKRMRDWVRVSARD